jgi:hypothetical protein
MGETAVPVGSDKTEAQAERSEEPAAPFPSLLRF